MAATLMILYARAQSPKASLVLARGIFGLLCLELAINYVMPAFYLYGENPSTARDPYKGAPFVDFLQQRNTDHSRIFGRESLLYPNWSAAFALSDVRSLDALYDKRYIAFIRSFLLKAGRQLAAMGTWRTGLPEGSLLTTLKPRWRSGS